MTKSQTEDIIFVTNRDQIAKPTSSSCYGTDFNKNGESLFDIGTATAGFRGKLDPRRSWKMTNCNVLSKNIDVDIDPIELKRGTVSLPGSFPAKSLSKLFKNRDILIYVHGFNTDFSEAVETTAALQGLYNQSIDENSMEWIGEQARDVRSVSFSWPSKGRASIKSYWIDKKSALKSSLANAGALTLLLSYIASLHSELPDRKIHILVSSMGAFALRTAIQTLRHMSVSLASLPKIDNVFITSADEDYDALSKTDKLLPIYELSDAVHVYHAQSDKVLEISSKLNSYPRLGRAGLKNIDKLNPATQILDCRYLDSVSTNHGLFRVRQEIINDIAATMIGRETNRPDLRARHPQHSGHWLLKRRF